jgi:hypothetical protein
MVGGNEGLICKIKYLQILKFNEDWKRAERVKLDLSK